MWTNALFGVSLFGTLSHGKPDHATLVEARNARPIDYPRPDNVISFDRLTMWLFGHQSRGGRARPSEANRSGNTDRAQPPLV
jgi:hypothetical protein